MGQTAILPPVASHTPVGHLTLLVFEAVLEVVCVSLPGYIVARQGMFDAESQKFVANLNVALFTPCLIFTKLASQLSASKLVDLAIIPVIFLVQTLVSYVCSVSMARAFGLKKRPSNFVIAMGVFGNSNSLPISLVLSLARTIKGLHWDRIPGDNDDEVAARGILYLLIFQQLGQLLRWSWGYHVLLAPPDHFKEEDEHVRSEAEQGRIRYKDDSSSEEDHAPLLSSGLGGGSSADDLTKSMDGAPPASRKSNASSSQSESAFDSGGQTPITQHQYAASVSSTDGSIGARKDRQASTRPPIVTPTNGNSLIRGTSNGHITSFPTIKSPSIRSESSSPPGPKSWLTRARSANAKFWQQTYHHLSSGGQWLFEKLPKSVQTVLSRIASMTRRFLAGVWEFMNPPLWAMLAAIIVASIPSLQRLFFTPGTFVQNSVTSAIRQSGGVAVPLILVVLGANLARNTLPNDVHRIEDEKLNRKLLVASLISRMLLPTVIMAPLLALTAKYVPVSILDDPIFVIVCFLLTGAPSALQLAQICQINGVYETVMSKLLFQSYVIWIMPSTLVLVMCALEVVRWARID